MHALPMVNKVCDLDQSLLSLTVLNHDAGVEKALQILYVRRHALYHYSLVCRQLQVVSEVEVLTLRLCSH